MIRTANWRESGRSVDGSVEVCMWFRGHHGAGVPKVLPEQTQQLLVLQESRSFWGTV